LDINTHRGEEQKEMINDQDKNTKDMNSPQTSFTSNEVDQNKDVMENSYH
jgi:hypothetical protein